MERLVRRHGTPRTRRGCAALLLSLAVLPAAAAQACSPATLTVPDASVAEPSDFVTSVDMLFTATLSNISDCPMTFKFTTANLGPFGNHNAYVAGSDPAQQAIKDVDQFTQQVTIPAGMTSATLHVPVFPDNRYEGGTQSFGVTFSNASAGLTLPPQAKGTITDTDPMPAVTITGSSVFETSSRDPAWHQNLPFNVTEDRPTDFPVSFDFDVTSGTAKMTDTDPPPPRQGYDGAMEHYHFVRAPAGDQFTEGTAHQIVNYPAHIVGDYYREPDESFTVTISHPQDVAINTATATGTIQNDDTQAVLEGTIRTEDGAVRPGIPLQAQASDGHTFFDTTANDGTYMLVVNPDLTYTITPTFPAGQESQPVANDRCTPSGLNCIVVADADKTGIDWGKQRYDLTGTVTNSAGKGVEGVVLDISGPDTTTVTTDRDGKYTASQLKSGDYVVTPHEADGRFVPRDGIGACSVTKAQPVSCQVKLQDGNKEAHFLSQVIFEMTTEMGVAVRDKDPEHPTHQLIQAGTAFSVHVTFKNHSPSKTLLVWATPPALEGNASDGHYQEQGAPIQVGPAVSSMAAVGGPVAIELEPLQELTVDTVVRTSASETTGAFPSREAVLAGLQTGLEGGGTRARVTYALPDVATLDDQYNATPLADSQKLLADEDKLIEQSIDDHGGEVVPPDGWVRTYEFTAGLLRGVYSVTAGAVHGAFVDVPKLLAHGLIAVPSATYMYATYLYEMWKATKDDPALQARMLAELDKKVTDAFLNAPHTLAKKRDELLDQANAAALAHFTKVFDAWGSGTVEGYTYALRSLGEDTGQGVGQVALAVGPGVLARWAPAAELLEASRLQVAAKANTVFRSLESSAPTLTALTEDALIRARIALPSGVTLADDAAAAEYQMGARKLASLKDQAKSLNKIIVAKGRSEGALLWDDALAVAKPETIPFGTAQKADVVLGTEVADHGSSIMVDMSKQEFGWAMTRQGIEKGSAEYQAAFEQWTERSKQYVKNIEDMRQYARDGRIPIDFRYRTNGVNAPDAGAYLDFRMTREPLKYGGDKLILEARPPGTAVWRRFDSDQDLLAVLEPNMGRPSPEDLKTAFDAMRTDPDLTLRHGDTFSLTADYERITGKSWVSTQNRILFDTKQAGLAIYPDGTLRTVRFVPDLSPRAQAGAGRLMRGWMAGAILYPYAKGVGQEAQPDVKPDTGGDTVLAPANVRGERAQVSGDGHIGVPVNCGQATTCTGSLTVTSTAGGGRLAERATKKRKKARVLGRARLAIPAGRTRTIRLRLNPAGRRLMRRHRSITVSVTLVLAGRRVVSPLQLGHPPARKHRRPRR